MDKKRTSQDEYFIFCTMCVLRFFSFSGIALGGAGRGTCWECRVSRIRDWRWPLFGFLFWTLSQAEMVRIEDGRIYIRRLGLM